MKIDKTKLQNYWYEDVDGNKLPLEENEVGRYSKKTVFYVSRFPLELSTTHYRVIKQSDVDKCRHPRKSIRATGGWVEGIKGRECMECGGTQTKKKWHRWGKKWEGSGVREICALRGTYSEDLVLKMVNSGEYNLSEAIIICSSVCERCLNVLYYKYFDGTEGYAEHSEEWCKANTECEFCIGEK